MGELLGRNFDSHLEINLFQLRKILFPEFTFAAFARLSRLLLDRAQLHPAYLAGDGLWQIGEFDSPHALIGPQPSTNKGEDLFCQLPRGLCPGNQRQKCLGDVPADRVGTRDHGGLGDRSDAR